MVLPGGVERLALVADQDLLRPDADPAPVAVAHACAPSGTETSMPCMSTVARSPLRLLIVPSIRLDWPRKFATNVVPRVLVEVVGCAHLLDQAGVHHRDGVGHGHGLLLVVGDVDERDADLRLDALELDLHRAAQLEVEGAQRLVEQQHLGLVDQCSGQRDALLLATGELGRPLAGLASRARPARASSAPASSTFFFF